jgi:hypothetical protein
MAYGGDTNANILMPSLIAGEDFTIPDVDLTGAIYTIPGDENSALYNPVVRVTNEELTQKLIDGTGTFDVIMGGFRTQLMKEFSENRISGAEYTKAFIALSESAMANAVQFLLSREQGFWQAAAAQAQAITAKVNLATAKVQYAAMRLEAVNNKATYALTKLRLATEDANFGQAKFQLDVLLPLQEDQLTAQVAGQGKQNDILDFQLDVQMPAQVEMINEQKEAQRAQTMNTRSDNVTSISGLLGKQKDLYSQQITSYQRDAEVKAVKLFTDIWNVNKTIDETVPVPKQVQVYDGETPGQTAGEGPLYDMLLNVKNNNGL